MGALWDSHYDGVKQLIDTNPVKITWPRYPQKDNGYGVMVNDTSAEPEELAAWVRVSRQRGGVHGAAAGQAGLSAGFSMYVLALPDADLKEGDIVTADAGAIQKWKIGPVDGLSVEGGCYAKQAPLIRADG